MSDLQPSRLEKLRIVEGFLRHQLGQVEKWIAEEQQRQAEQRRGRERRPPVPDWVLEVGIGAGKPPVAVHVGGCHMSGKRVRGISRDEARHALTDGVQACTHCRADTELGVLE
ncbi:DUF6233 domain-containing protein [Streptomyces huasconensis]|uniref:DUF6233 domain-containing protein n=1 Tax=Streptomyces huasconensis TaxID=1854574 RepID=UPI0036F52542